MKNEKSNPAGSPLFNETANKDNDYFSNNQFINELNRRIAEVENPKVKKRVSLFDVVSAVGLTVIIIRLILQW